MVYRVVWRASDPDKSLKSAHEIAGPCHRGYLYRFYDDTGRGVSLTAFPILKRTPCGWRIKIDGLGATRFVREKSFKKFACPTIELAIESYIARKKRQASIYKARFERAEDHIRTIKGESSIWF